MKTLVMVTLLSVAAGFSLPSYAQSKAPDAQQFVGSPKGAPLAGAALDEQAHKVSGLLRCPVCQGLSVADSPAEMAVNMKRQVRDLLSRGYTEEQILQYFELSYGQFVLLRPKFQGMNVLVWILPIAALLLGFAVVAFKIRKLSAKPVERQSPPIASAEAPDDPYLAQVRELVGGGKQ
jgi:cytochrome c-type biogenesis protein CcmH